MNSRNRLRTSAVALVAVVIVGTIGYVLLGFTFSDAVYQTVTTISTVGFREIEPLDTVGRAFTMALIVAGVGTAFYTLGAAFETVVDGRLVMARRRKHMDRAIADVSDHVVVCGWGRVGQAIAQQVTRDGKRVVVIDRDAARLDGVEHLHIVGDATLDAVLVEAGIHRAAALIAAIDTDAENLYVTLSGRSLQPDLFVIARARDEGSEAKLRRAGADRVVNPQAIGGARMAAFISQPHVAEFLDIVMHDRNVDFRLEEVLVRERSALVGRTLREAKIRERTGALVLALRDSAGRFVTRPAPEAALRAGDVLIAIGTPDEIASLSVISDELV